MNKIAIVGGGISGVSLFRELTDHGVEVHLYEKESKLGGLIRCQRESGHLYHLLGGHVFNSKSAKVLEWIDAKIPDYKNAMSEIQRNATISFDFGEVRYPIENHLYELPEELGKKALGEILLNSELPTEVTSFGSFLKANFGDTLYQTYFEPYNWKIWGKDLEKIPLEWLEGKLPMPSRQGIIEANVFREREIGMVHSSFFYPKHNGSQYWVDSLFPDGGVVFHEAVTEVEKLKNGAWQLNGRDVEYSQVVYTGDITTIESILKSPNDDLTLDPCLKKLKARGISNALCRVPRFNESWKYLPERAIASNRIINTGAFSSDNTAVGEHSAVFEFPYKTAKEQMEFDIQSVYPDATIIATNHVEKAYVIQEKDTRERIQRQKDQFENHGLFLLGRFAEWEYYNMDKCIEASINLAHKFL